MPNLDPWINQIESNHSITRQTEIESGKFENHLVSIRDEHQKMIRPNCHSTYNETYEKIIEMIDLILEKYRSANQGKENNLLRKNKEKEQLWIDNILEDLDQKREMAITNIKKSMWKDEVNRYREEERTLDYMLFIIRDFAGKLISRQGK